MWVIFYEQQKEESCQPSGCKIFFSLVIEKYQIDILTNDTNVCKTFKATPEINQNYDLFPIRSNKALMKFKWEQTFISKYFWTKSRRKLIPLLIVPSFFSILLSTFDNCLLNFAPYVNLRTISYCKEWLKRYKNCLEFLWSFKPLSCCCILSRRKVCYG